MTVTGSTHRIPSEGAARPLMARHALSAGATDVKPSTEAEHFRAFMSFALCAHSPPRLTN